MAASFLAIDDHPLFLDALRLAIHAAYPDAEIVAAASIAEAHEALATRGGGFDLVLLDLFMPGIRSFDGLLDLRRRYPKVPIVIISAHEDPRIIHEAMRSGAAGFIPKSVRKPELVRAIEDVLSGSITLPEGYEPSRAAPLPQPSPRLADRLASLTPQQIRVLQMLRQGKLNKQIAYELHVGETTVKAHVSEILRKLNVASRTQAVIEVAKSDFDSLMQGGGRGG